MYRSHDRIFLFAMSEDQQINFIVKNYKLNEETARKLISDELIPIKSVRNAMIKQEFEKAYRNPLMSVTQIYHYLCATYDVSYSHVRFLLKK